MPHDCAQIAEKLHGTRLSRFIQGVKSGILAFLVQENETRIEKNREGAAIDAAYKFIGVDRLSISPQCGFASTAAGSRISVAGQPAKLELVVEVAREVWG